MGDVQEIRRLERAALNPQSTGFFRSMYNVRHLGRLPLPEGEGTEWGMFRKYADLNVLL